MRAFAHRTCSWALLFFVAMGVVASLAAETRSQPCSSASFPYRTMVRSDADIANNTAEAADVSLAVSPYRIIAMSNSGSRIHCKAGSPLTNRIDLAGSNADTAVFKRTTSVTSYWMTDPRVIYDRRDGVFWAVAVEWCYVVENGNFTWKARIHLAVSTSSSPSDWSTTYWHKYTGDGLTNVYQPSIDPASTAFAPDHFADNQTPDRPTIAVDRDYFYICLRQGTPGGNFATDKMFIAVLPKGTLEAGSATTITNSQFIDTGQYTQTSMHALAVDDDIPSSGTHRVYMVVLPNHKTIGPGDGHQYTSIRIGAFSECTSCATPWVYQSYDKSLDASQQFIGMDSVADDAKGNGLDAFVNYSLFWNAVTRTLDSDSGRRIWCVHHVRPVPATQGGALDPALLQWHQINLRGWPDSGQNPTFDRVERIVRTNPAGSPIPVFDGAISANKCGDVALGFNQGAFLYNGSWTYPQFWRALYPNGGSASIAVVATGASQYYDPGPNHPGKTVWADYSGVVADPSLSSRFFGHHVTVYDDGAPNPVSYKWESWLAQWNFGSCTGAGLMAADFDQDMDVDLDDLNTFSELAAENDPASDLDESGQIDALDMVILLNAIGEEP